MTGGATADDARGAHEGDGGVDVARLAERVYRLLLDDVRCEQVRRGARGLPPAGA